MKMTNTFVMIFTTVMCSGDESMMVTPTASCLLRDMALIVINSYNYNS